MMTDSFKIKINHKTRYRVNPTQGTLKPNETVAIAIKIDVPMVNEILQQSFDTNKPVDCKDKFLVLSIPVPDQGIAHLAEQNEKDRIKTLAALFSNPHVKKKQSKLKFDDNRFESAYWSQQLDADAVRREGSGADGKAAAGGVADGTVVADASGSGGSASSSSSSGVSGSSGESASVGGAGSSAADSGGGSETGAGPAAAAAPAADGSDGSAAGGDARTNTAAAAAAGDTSNSLQAAGTFVVDDAGGGGAAAAAAAAASDAASGSVANSDGDTATVRLAATGVSGSSGSDQGGSGMITAASRSSEAQSDGGEAKVKAGSEDSAAAGGRGDGQGGIMKNVTRAEHERVIKDMILIRNKYTSLLKTAIKHTAERDKFEELLHKARAETNKVRV